jgi:hypothetical protein
LSRKIQSAVRQAVTITALAVILTMPVVMAHAQEVQEPSRTPASTPTPEPTAIPANEIPDRAAAIGPLLRKATTSTDISEEVAKIAEDFKREQEHLAGLMEETQLRIEAGGPASIIEDSQNAWLRSATRLEGWLSTLKTHSTTIAEQKKILEEERHLWGLTMASSDEVELPEATRQQVEDTLAAIDRTETTMRVSRDNVLTLQSAVAKEKAAVGTDPQVVIDILVGVASDHSEVMSDPEPAALFRGFGESSLDFQLRAWTRGDFVQVSSDLLVAVNNALADADIEIPFPQRDLHLRSVDGDAAERLAGRGSKKREITPE